MVYTNLKANELKLHGLFESSRLESTDVGRIYDALVQDATGKNIDVDNGVAIKIGDFTGKGLQEVAATIAKTTDKIAVVGAPALVKSAMTKEQEQPYNFYIPAGTLAKAYSVKEEYQDIFAVAAYQFTNETEAGDTDMSVVKQGNYVVVDGTGKWTAVASAPSATQYGFIGKIHSVSAGNYYTIVRILTVQNKDITA